MKFVSFSAWLAAFSLVAFAGYLGYQKYILKSTLPFEPVQEQPVAAISPMQPVNQTVPTSPADLPVVNLPAYPLNSAVQSIWRHSTIHTTIPKRSSEDICTYTVDLGDSIFEIASNFKVKPETVLWANYKQLNDNPDMISKGMELQIPPVDGVYYQWQAGDTIESVAARFKAEPQDILNWSANNIDLTDPQVQPGTKIMIPGGSREFRQWVIPTIPRGAAGVMTSIYGSGGCSTSTEGAMGTGSFVWPGPNHSISGNDYWGGHLGIDVAGSEGTPAFAADSGVVVYAGWANGGYGYMVMIDHGNGYQTLYAHLSSVIAHCGGSVSKGSTIGLFGSTGNSTGAHLHFEVRYGGGFVSPWTVLP